LIAWDPTTSPLLPTGAGSDLKFASFVGERVRRLNVWSCGGLAFHLAAIDWTPSLAPDLEQRALVLEEKRRKGAERGRRGIRGNTAIAAAAATTDVGAAGVATGTAGGGEVGGGGGVISYSSPRRPSSRSNNGNSSSLRSVQEDATTSAAIAGKASARGDKAQHPIPRTPPISSLPLQSSPSPPVPQPPPPPPPQPAFVVYGGSSSFSSPPSSSGSGSLLPELILDLRTPHQWRPDLYPADAFERQV
jgi:hypothetical protein